LHKTQLTALLKKDEIEVKKSIETSPPTPLPWERGVFLDFDFLLHLSCLTAGFPSPKRAGIFMDALSLTSLFLILNT
jgi:hypothetical protein